MTTRPQLEPHLDADQLNAFAEGALSPSERTLCLQHLAECARCREIAFLAGASVPLEAPAPTPAPRFSVSWRAALSLGAATLAALIIAVLLFHHTREKVRPAPAQIATESATAAPPQSITEAPTSQPTPLEPPRAHAAPKPSPARRTAPEPAAPLPQSLQGRDANGLDSITASAQPAATTPQQSATTGGTFQGGSGSAATLAKTAPPQASAAASKTAPASPLRTYSALSALRAPDGFAQIAGTITDGSGATVPHAKVTLDQTSGTAHRETLSDASGRFTISSLPPGKYRLEISSPGFMPQAREVELGTSQVARVDSQLAVGSVSQTVAVEAAAPALNTESASVQSALQDKAPLQTSVTRGSRTLALDNAGKLFLSKKAGKHWKSVHGPWKKSPVTNLSVTPDQQFKVMTAQGSWLSADGEHWHPAS